MIDFYACCGEEPTEGAAACFAAPAGIVPAISMIGERLDQPAISRPRCLRIARHESAHAVLALIAGVHVEHIEIDPACICRTAQFDGSGRVAFLLAGPAADAWHRSAIAGMSEEAIKPWIAGIRMLRGGSCDHCRAIRSALVETRHADDATVIAAFRHHERLAGLIVRHPAVWAAICDIADRLMAAGSLDGASATEIALSHINLAEFRPFLES